MSELPYYLGCPIWSKPEWVGTLFTQSAKPGDYLRQYAEVYNTVEGNTTFYALPKPETVQKWRAETPSTFRFCFKFPQTISHHLRLQHAEKEAIAFLNLLAPLGERLGPFFLQLPSSFGNAEAATLEKFLKALPQEFRYAVEVRHWDFFNEGAAEKWLVSLLAELHMGRVIFDTRGLHAVQAERGDAITREAQRKKPKVPVRYDAVSGLPFVRFVGDPIIANNESMLQEWAQRLSHWLNEGQQPYLFMHAPNDVEAPLLANYFHSLVQKLRPEVAPLPTWPGTRIAKNTQLGLF